MKIYPINDELIFEFLINQSGEKRKFSYMTTFNEYIKTIRASGKIYFTLAQATSDLAISKNAVYSRLYRAKNGDIVSPAKGFFIIIPSEYKKFGSLPRRRYSSSFDELLATRLLCLPTYSRTLSRIFSSKASNVSNYDS